MPFLGDVRVQFELGDDGGGLVVFGLGLLDVEGLVGLVVVCCLGVQDKVLEVFVEVFRRFG